MSTIIFRIRLKPWLQASHIISSFSVFRFSEDSILNEVASILQEWTEVWHELYLQRDHGKFSQLKKLMEQLLDLRKQYTLGK